MQQTAAYHFDLTRYVVLMGKLFYIRLQSVLANFAAASRCTINSMLHVHNKCKWQN